MSNKLTKDINRNYELGDINELPVLGGEIIYQGGAVGLEVSSGYVRDLEVGDKFLGFAETFVDASNAADGVKNIRVKTRGVTSLELNGASLLDVGKSIYAINDNTFSLSNNSSVYIGQIIRHQFGDDVIVDFDAARINPS